MSSMDLDLAQRLAYLLERGQPILQRLNIVASLKSDTRTDARVLICEFWSLTLRYSIF